MKNFEPDFANRLTTAAQAKQALIKKAKAKNPANDPEYAKKQAERRALNVSRAAEQRARDGAPDSAGRICAAAIKASNPTST